MLLLSNFIAVKFDNRYKDQDEQNIQSGNRIVNICQINKPLVVHMQKPKYLITLYTLYKKIYIN